MGAGTTVAYREAGTGAALTFLHPIGLSSAWFAPELEALATQRRALAVDLPGHGDSAPIDPLTIASLAEAVVGLWDRLGVASSAIVGISLGGMVALKIAIEFPTRARSLMLVSTSSHPDTPARAVMLERAQTAAEQGVDPLIPAQLERWFSDKAVATNAPFVAAARSALKSVDPRSHAACWRAIADLDVRDGLSRVGVPTDVIVGSDDSATPPASARVIAGSVRDARLKVLPGAKHMFAFEDRALFRRLLAEFQIRDADL